MQAYKPNIQQVIHSASCSTKQSIGQPVRNIFLLSSQLARQLVSLIANQLASKLYHQPFNQQASKEAK